MWGDEPAAICCRTAPAHPHAPACRLSAGLSTEFAVQAVAEKESSPEDADSSIVASYYVHRLLALEEEAIQQAWLKVWECNMA